MTWDPKNLKPGDRVRLGSREGTVDREPYISPVRDDLVVEVLFDGEGRLTTVRVRSLRPAVDW